MYDVGEFAQEKEGKTRSIHLILVFTRTRRQPRSIEEHIRIFFWSARTQRNLRKQRAALFFIDQSSVKIRFCLVIIVVSSCFPFSLWFHILVLEGKNVRRFSWKGTRQLEVFKGQLCSESIKNRAIFVPLCHWIC